MSVSIESHEVRMSIEFYKDVNRVGNNYILVLENSPAAAKRSLGLWCRYLAQDERAVEIVPSEIISF